MITIKTIDNKTVNVSINNRPDRSLTPVAETLRIEFNGTIIELDAWQLNKMFMMYAKMIGEIE